MPVKGCDATILADGFAAGFDVACAGARCAAGFLTAGFVAVARLAAACFTAGFAAADFLVVAVFAPASRAPDRFATSFLAVVLSAGLRVLAVAAVDCRVCERAATTFLVALLVPARFVPALAVRVAFDFALRSCAVLGRETFTRPRIARPDAPPFAAALAVARRVDLLCEVEAMGTALVTVVTW